MGGRHQAIAHLERIVGERHQLQVVRLDVPLVEHPLAHPVHEPAPVAAAHEQHRELGDLPGLDERERLPELVHRPVTAREDHEPAGVAHEHDLAREEIVEVERDVAVGVAALLEGKLDVEAHRQRAGVPGAAVRRLHDPGAAARDDREPALADDAGGLARELVVRVAGGRARGAEEACGGRHAGKRVEALAQLGRDPVDAVLVRERRADRRLLGGDDLFVEGPRLAWHRPSRLDGRRSRYAGHQVPPSPKTGKYEFAHTHRKRNLCTDAARRRG